MNDDNLSNNSLMAEQFGLIKTYCSADDRHHTPLKMSPLPISGFIGVRRFKFLVELTRVLFLEAKSID